MSEPTILKLIDKPDLKYINNFIKNVKCNNTHSLTHYNFFLIWNSIIPTPS